MAEELAVSLICGFIFGCIGSVIGASIRMRWEAHRG